MSLASRIAASSRRPTATVRLNGARWSGALSLSRDQSYGQGTSGGEVVGRDPPVAIVEGETAISWTWGYDGYETAGFSGVVTKILQRSYPNQWRLQVADPLWLANVRRSDLEASPLNNIAASAAITQFLGAAGLSRMSISALAASGSAWGGSEWVLGTLTPVSFANTTPLSACQQICEVLGYWLYCDAAGVTRAVLMERRPSDSPFRTLVWGQDFLLAGPPERERDASQVKNRIAVKGANTGVQGAQIHDEWQSGAADRTLEYSSGLIEYVNESQAGAASCTGVAKRLLLIWSRQPTIIRIPRLKADPRLAVGMTVAIQCALIGYSSATPFFIYSLSTSLDLRKGDFSQTLVLDGGTGDQGYTTLPPPEASFSWRLVAETLDGTGVVEVFLDGTGSHSLGDGEIVSYAWASATAVATGYSASASGPRAMFVYPAATTTASITLTVTDTSSKTGSITQDVPLAGDDTTALSRSVIALALGSAWAVTPDGGATWRVEATGDSTLVPESGPLISTRGTGSTGLRATADALASASTALASLGGQITALSQTPGTTRVWAAVGASLYRSTDAGATFALWGTLPSSVSAVLEDPAVPSSVLCLAGANLYHSTLETPGTAWVVLYAGPAGATARHLVRGESGATTWICYAGTFSGSPLQRVEGPISATFPLGTSPAVSEVRAIALGTDELSVYAWDGQGRGWSVDSATGIATAIAAALGSGETAQHALYDPDESIIYLATFGATAGKTYKYLPLADKLAAFYTPASGQQAHRVGIGGPASALPGNIIVPTWGVSGANDGIWFHSDAGWTRKAPPVAGAYWFSYTANPFNAAEGILLGNSAATSEYAYSSSTPVRMADGTHSPIWHTTDAGATWTAIDITAPALSGPELATILRQVVWPAVGGWVVGGAIGSYAVRQRAVVWRASGVATTNDGDHEGLVAIAPGQDGEILVAHEWGDGISSVSLAGVWSPALLAPSGANVTSIVAMPSGRTCYAIAATVLLRTSDYRSGALGAVSGVPSGAYSAVAVADGDVYVIRGDGGPGLIVSRLSGGVSTDLDHAASVSNWYPQLVTNRSRSAIAWVWRYVGFRSYDGSAWITIPFPPGLDQGNFGGFAITDEGAS